MAGTTLWWGTVSVVLVLVFPALSHGSPCTVVVDQHEYDLSSLATQDYWQMRETQPNGEDLVIYFSLCHPLRNVPSECAGNGTSVCMTKESSQGTQIVTVPNAGQVSTKGPTFTEGQMVEYVMEDGESCPDAGGEKYRTYVNFICARTPEAETGPKLMNIARCQLLVAWMTQSACPQRLDVVTDTACSIQFPSSPHQLHLQTLRSEHFYSAASVQPNARYEINICGSVENGSCGGNDVAVCRLPEGGSPQVLATTQNMKVRWEQDESLVLAYQASHQGQDVEIQFMCYRSTDKTEVNYVTQNDTAVTFVVRSSAVCPPTPAPRCVLEDHAGNVYDLRPLHREQDNWEVVRSTTDGRAVLYFLNICGPVNPGRHYTCPPGLIGACQAGRGVDAAYNLGLLNSEPTINTENGSITIIYNGGEPCKGGQHSHSTRINLVCSSEEHGPLLAKETETCEHVFDWLTPVACSRHLSAGSGCQVNDTLYGNVFDLNPLRNIHKDYKMTNDGDEFLINLCGPLVSSCDGETGTSGVCQITNGQQMNAGFYTNQLIYNDGTLMMKYTNGTSHCQDNDTRSSQIIFLCDHEASGRDGPMFVNQIECINSFFWKTKYACPSFHVVDCTLYTAEGMMYDLQELSLSDSNLEFYTDQKKFVLNVCRSVVHQKGSRCAYRAGSCIVDRTHLNSSVNIGEVQSGPYLEDGRLMIKYAGGDQCVGHSQLYQTVIEFICDKDETFLFPQLVGEENCTYYFEIKSAAGCPVSVENISMPLAGRDCTVTSPTGYVFDLSSLRRETDYVVKGNNNMSLTLNVCGALNHPECHGEGVGICSHSINGGQANANLNYLSEHLSLHYTGGEQCSEHVNRSTIITFVCGAENVTEGPVLVFDDTEQCMYFITWYTELACEKRISCFVDTYSHRIDLSPLIKSTTNYEVVNSENPREKFYLNVCRPLNPIIGLNCRPGSAVCISSSVEGKNPLSLGHPNVTPASDGDGGASVMYTHGAKCPTEPDYNLSSKIHFICDPSAGKGNPVFKEMTHDCQYQFEWRTSVVCNLLFKEEDSGPQCQIRYDQAKANIDLKPLYHPKGYHVKFGSKTFTVNVCGSACNTSGTCSSDGDSYGLSSKSELEWHYGQLMLKYYGGSQCDGSVSGHKSTTVLFECDMSAGYGFPVPDDLMRSMDCVAVFRWNTNVTCIEGIYATEDTPAATLSSNSSTAGQNNPSKESLKDKTTTTHSTVSAVIATILVVSGVIFVVTLVIMKSRRGNHIVAATRRLFGIHGFGHSRQVRVENSALLRTNSVAIFRTDDSDDDLLRV